MANVLTVRAALPSRSKVAAQTRYTLYRDELRRDFISSCGYCGDDDARIDRIGFHIDHFAPRKLFPDLECDYGNLVYACRFCNISKSDHWVGNNAAVHNDGTKGFVDPCSEEYEKHLTRDGSGRIVAVTQLGAYISRRLRLDLLRHELLWQARRTRALRDEVKALIAEMEARDERSDAYINLLRRYVSLTEAIDDYELRSAA
ncbi:HNH endonuclease [Rhizobium sp. LEGMi135b]